MIHGRLDWQALFLKKENVLIAHILFWLLVTVVIILFKEYPDFLTEPAEIACFILQFVAFIAMPGYLNNTMVLPFFKRKKIILGLLLYAAQLLLLTLFLPYVFSGIAQVFVALFKVQQWVDWENENIAFNIFSFTIIASIVNIARERFQLQKEQKEAELKQLKQQLNPHFLFNTLNNLYGLSVLKSDKLPGLMLKLSDLLRYSMYETHQQVVSLEKELLYLKNYMELEKIRLEERTSIELTISGTFTPYSIAPLLLVVFIENSFKHHSASRNQQGLIRTDISIRDGVFQMIQFNSLDPGVKTEGEKKAGGIGLVNVKKRLALIYGENHTLTIEKQPEYYQVNLKIILK